MGNLLGCVEEVPELQRLKYDMSPLKSKKLPMVWLVGPPGSGRNTHGESMAGYLKYDHIKIADLLRKESNKETERGAVIKNYLEERKRVPDTIVIDLLKEEMLVKAETSDGFILNGFPRTSKQAVLFVKEISDVEAIIYLYSNTNDMVTRVQQKHGDDLSADNIKKDIMTYMKEARDSTAKFSGKLERVYTDAPVSDVFKKIEAALNVRMQTTLEPKMSLETSAKMSIKADA